MNTIWERIIKVGPQSVITNTWNKNGTHDVISASSLHRTAYVYNVAKNRCSDVKVYTTNLSVIKTYWTLPRHYM